MFLLFILCFPVTIFAQTVFAPAGAKWYYSFPSDDTADLYVLLESEKDTTIQGYDCKKIKRTDYRLYAGPNSSPYYDTTAGESLYTYVSGDTVFYYHNIFEQFVPLYFFNVTVGDTLGFYIPPDTFCYYPSMDDSLFYASVDSVDTVHVSNVPLRRIQQVYGIVMGNPDFFVMGSYMERTGALHDFMINHNCNNTIPEVSYPVLRCYSDGDIYYNIGSRPCDDLWVSISGISSPWNDIEIYPNPAQSVVHIGNTLCPYDLDVKMYDAMGRLYKTAKCDRGSMCRINVNGMSNGIYWIAIENTTYGFSKKMKLLIEN